LNLLLTKCPRGIPIGFILALADRPYNRLSVGQRQWVLIVRAIAQGTGLILLDEPTSSLDYSNQIHIRQNLRKIAEQGVTLLARSHDPNHVSWYCDQLIAMNDEGILARGRPADVLSQDNLDRIYRGVCSVKKLGSYQIIVPQEVLDA